MIQATCIVCSQVYREQDDGKDELCQTHGICGKCLEEIKLEKEKKKEAKQNG